MPYASIRSIEALVLGIIPSITVLCIQSTETGIQMKNAKEEQVYLCYFSLELDRDLHCSLF